MNLHPTVCFSGYRPEKFTFLLEWYGEECSKLRQRIGQSIIQAQLDGYRRFLCGMAMGFDLLCGEVLLEVQSTNADCADLELVAVLPFAGHKASGYWRRAHRLVVDRAVKVVTVAPAYRPGIYFQRNRYMVDQSGRLICYYDGRPGGTAHTFSYATRKGCDIVNLAERWIGGF